MAKKLATHFLIVLLVSLGGIAILVTMDALGSTLPERIIRRITRELPADKPDSYFVPTPLPLAVTEQGNGAGINAGISAGANTATNADNNVETGRVEIAQVGILKLDTPVQDVPVQENLEQAGNPVEVENPAQPTPSEFAILAATSTPMILPTTLSTTVAEENSQPPVENGATENPQSDQQPTGDNQQVAEAQPSPTVNNLGQPSNEEQSSSPIELPPLQLLPTGTPKDESATNDSAIPPTAKPKNAASAITLTGFSHEWQTWNNCGPATLAMNLSFFGSTLTQADIGAILRQHEDDKNVKPEEIVAFAQSQGYYAQMRVNGDSTLIKTLLSNEIPVLIETWLEPDPNDGMGHYRLLTGYNDEAQHWIAFDSYVSHDFVNSGDAYEGIILPYAETDYLWSVFNRTYLLIYTDAKADVVQAIFGNQLDPNNMWEQAVVDARYDVANEPNDPFVWFNLGSSLNEVGNYGEAAAAFDQARRLGLPWRMLWYQFGPFEAYYETQRYEEVMALAYATIANTESIEEIYYWKGRGLAATGNPESAQKAWQQALALNPSYGDAINALAGFE